MFKLLISLIVLCSCKPVSKLSVLKAGGSGGLNCPSGLNEISGVDFHQGTMYVVSDSGSEAAIGVLRSGSSSFERKNVSGASNNDWEALAVGPCPNGSSTCAYVSDLGDNGLSRSGGKIYVVDLNSFNLINTIHVSFEDGASHNVEAIAIDSIAPYDLYIIHKNWKGDSSSAIWKLAGEQKGSGSARLSKVCALSMANNQNDQITGADINGETMVYRGYHYVSKFDMSGIRRGQCNEQGPISGLSNNYESSDLREAVAFEGTGGNILTVSESCRSYSSSISLGSSMQNSPMPNS